ncbi:MAG: hypothetical protein JW983_10720, partial [Elusimicrobia bacterium]|nr:hypothetical protein [Elusimicrobiota bacterium]
MKPIPHIVISFSVSAVLYTIFRSYILALTAFLFGIFIDIDHLLDYFREQGFNLDVRNFFYFFTEFQYRKAVIFLHSWELFLIYSLLVFLVPANEVMFGIFIGYSVHLIADHLGNPVSPLGYFFVYRWKNDFLREKLLWHIELPDY